MRGSVYPLCNTQCNMVYNSWYPMTFDYNNNSKIYKVNDIKLIIVILLLAIFKILISQS